MTRARRSLSMMVTAALSVASLAWIGAPPAVAAGEKLGSGGEYHAIEPQVVLAAREGSKVGPVRRPARTSPSGTRLDVDVSGLKGLPEDVSDVLALVVNVQVWSATSPGSVTLFSSQYEKAPRGPTVVFDARKPANNLVVARLSAAGALGVVLRSDAVGTASVRITVTGWVSTTSSGERGARLFATPPSTVFDSQSNVLGPREIVKLDLRGRSGVPDTPDVIGVVLNVVVENDRPRSTRTNIAISPTRPRPQRLPGVSDMTVGIGQTTSNVVFARLNEAGNVHLSNSSGYTDARVTVVGYLIDGISASRRRGRIVPLARPFVAIDTRSELSGNVPLGPGVAEEWDFAPTIDSTTYPNGQTVGEVSVVIGTLSALDHVRQYPANPPSSTDLRVYPSGGLPNMVTVAVAEGSRASNATIARLTSSDRITVYNRAGFTHYTLVMSAVVLSDEAA